MYLELVERLAALDELLPRLEKGECEASSGRAPEVSIRELVQRRSRTALSCRIEARLLREACMRNDAELPPVSFRPAQPNARTATAAHTTTPL